MKSIRELYKIGHGPSSSHTMGPEKACELFKERYPEAIRFKVTLYGSLAMTGKGHLTDYIVKKKLGNVEVIFDDQQVLWHPNTMDITGYDDEGRIFFMRAYSIGGGSIRIDGEELDSLPEVYPHSFFEDIRKYCEDNKISLFDYVKRFEDLGIMDFLGKVYDTMMETIDLGLTTTGFLPGELHLKRKAQFLWDNKLANENQEVTRTRIISSFAYATAEENASGGIVVTAPTCGSAGVVPAVLRYLRDRDGYDREKCLESLAVAGIIGNVIKHNASISGAIAGCQAEIGSASAMASAMHSYLLGMSLGQIEYAAEISMEHHLGLTCDPVLGYVQIPCIERNAVGALRATDSSRLAFFLSQSRKISLDMVIDTMYQTGKDIHTKYRETGIGGLALLYQKIKDEKEQ
ncbi:MAG TPA: L-serine ammonia-lyase, iron-sulfur-dependent, subunit alpha [Bacillota bacterium]|nr:L-serine ammonia-lyase, iron-sulfur-dependent, subunit alpha [Bacillota bacterium]HPQ61737.1 L-serine ammonia-lyase, iron-sulfur-dependent, subunit alpha [Bacillota bacterium]HRX91276.1 L-serine ammonia-lyase, iron-sulfur-dependent, subunit alpha [Candidatus Izemoplasmatales bacterium]